jgi:hypothetical protein
VLAGVACDVEVLCCAGLGECKLVGGRDGGVELVI